MIGARIGLGMMVARPVAIAARDPALRWCSCMKRRVRSATQCAGVNSPYGQVEAIGSGYRRPPGGVAPKRPNWPCASAR